MIDSALESPEGIVQTALTNLFLVTIGAGLATTGYHLRINLMRHVCNTTDATMRAGCLHLQYALEIVGKTMAQVARILATMISAISRDQHRQVGFLQA